MFYGSSAWNKEIWFDLIWFDNTCIMRLGEHLQETYAIEVNRDVTDKI